MKSRSKHDTDSMKANWNQQAALGAGNFLDFMSFSRSALIDQLLFEGFGQAEAEYGVNAVGFRSQQSRFIFLNILTNT